MVQHIQDMLDNEIFHKQSREITVLSLTNDQPKVFCYSSE